MDDSTTAPLGRTTRAAFTFPRQADAPFEDAPSRRACFALAGLAGAGLLVSTYLTLAHATTASGFGARLCSSGGLDCDRVARSHQGELFGVPLAAFGVVFYLVMLILALLPTRHGAAAESGREALLWVFSLAAVALVVGAYLVGVMVFRVGALCPLCLLTHGLNGALLVLAVRGMPPGLGPARLGRTRFLGGGVLLGLAFLLPLLGAEMPAGAGAPGGVQSIDVPGNELDARALLADEGLRDELVQAFRKAPAPVIDPELHEGPAKGSSDPEYEITVFGDFQCPYCRKLAGYLEGLFDAEGERVRIVFKHFPLSQDCNPDVPSRMHANACELALAAAAAFEQGDEAFWTAHDRLFGGDGLPGGAAPSSAARELLAGDVELGRRLGVQAIPAVFVNHRRIPDYRLLHPELFGLLEEVLGELEEPAGALR